MTSIQSLARDARHGPARAGTNGTAGGRVAPPRMLLTPAAVSTGGQCGRRWHGGGFRASAHGAQGARLHETPQRDSRSATPPCVAASQPMRRCSIRNTAARGDIAGPGGVGHCRVKGACVAFGNAPHRRRTTRTTSAASSRSNTAPARSPSRPTLSSSSRTSAPPLTSTLTRRCWRRLTSTSRLCGLPCRACIDALQVTTVPRTLRTHVSTVPAGALLEAKDLFTRSVRLDITCCFYSTRGAVSGVLLVRLASRHIRACDDAQGGSARH